MQGVVTSPSSGRGKGPHTLNVIAEGSKKLANSITQRKHNGEERRKRKNSHTCIHKGTWTAWFLRSERRAAAPPRYIKTNKRLLAVTQRPRGGSGGGASLRAAKIMSLWPRETGGEANFRSGSRQKQV